MGCDHIKITLLNQTASYSISDFSVSALPSLPKNVLVGDYFGVLDDLTGDITEDDKKGHINDYTDGCIAGET